MIEFLVSHYGKEEAIRRDAWRRLIWQIDGFEPTEMQAQYIFDNVRFKMVAGGVRAGKSQSPPRACDWFTCIDGGLIWIIGPDYYQARSEFDYLISPYLEAGFIQPKNVSKPKEGSWTAKIDGGALVETKSADNIVKIAGHAPDMMLVTEVGQHDADIVDKAQERALEKYAPVIFSGTFENAYTWYADTWDRWQGGIETYPGSEIVGFKSYSLPTWSNTFIFPLGQDDPRFIEMAENTPPGVYEERIEAIPFMPQGLVFRNDYHPDTHIGDFWYNPNLPLELAIDPALHTYAVEFVQWDGPDVYVVDEIYRHECITPGPGGMLELFKKHPLAEKVQGGVIDVAGKQQHANYSVVTLWKKGTGLTLRSSHTKIDTGINAMKLRLQTSPVSGVPRLMFSNRLSKQRDTRGRAGGILSEMQLYTWGKNFTASGTQKRSPVDANNDAIKALSYWLVDRYGDDIVQSGWTQEQRLEYPWKQRFVA